MKYLLSLFLLLLPSLVLGQVAVLSDTNQSLTVTLATAPATTQPNYIVTYRSGDIGEPGDRDSIGVTTGSTAKTVLSGATTGPRTVYSVQVYNADTASVTATISKVASSTSYSLVSATIPVGGTLVWTKDQGIKVLDSGGSNATATVGAVVSGVSDTVAVAETGSGSFRTTTITLTAMPVTVANTTGASFGGQQLYDFPEGRIFVLGVTAYFGTIDWSATTIGATGSGDYSLGSTVTTDATLNGTDIDMLPSSAMLDPFAAGIGRSNAGTALAAAAQFDGTTTAKDLFLNAIVDDADVGDGDSDIVLFSGTIVVNWVYLGDY